MGISKDRLNESICKILLIYMVILPWVTFDKMIKVTDAERKIYSEYYQGVNDLFLYGKAIFTMLVASILLVLIIIFLIKNTNFYKAKLKNNKYMLTILVLSFVYSWLVILSTLSSEYKEISVFGCLNGQEGMLMLIGYMILFVSAALFLDTKKSIHTVQKAMIILSCILIVLSLIELFYMPITQIIRGDEYQSDYKNMISLTLYNSNYYGALCTLLIPNMFSYFINARKIKMIVIYGIMSSMLVLCVIASKSTISFYLSILEIIFLLLYSIVTGYFRKEQKKKIFVKISILFGMFFILLMITSFSRISIIKNASDTSINKTVGIHKEEYYKVNDISIDKNILIIEGNENLLSVKVENNNFTFTNENNEMVPFEEDNGKLHFLDEYSMINVWVENDAIVFDLGYQETIRFYVYNDNYYPMLSDESIITDIGGNNLGHEELYSFATGRGYIWINTIPILKETILLGKGPGTFELYFKQYDFVGLLNSQGNVNLIMDKPHSFYLQSATQTGIISAIIITVMMLLIVIKAIIGIKKQIKYWKENKKANRIENKKEVDFIFGLTIACIAFMILNIINDSMVVVNPIFWIMLGVLYGNVCKKDFVMEV